ncbi:MAG: hypothetical protein KKE17_14745 [Proteobacteria bacterium]|nr:hypothetical protein [Pseudomonadota bacterium]MBU1711257.1 hypothetical protein [Pseudomonadota bacterium]
MKSGKNIISIAAAGFFLLYAGSAYAAITGVCSNCHTMHNSQNGSQVTGVLQGALLNDDCAGCHSGPGNDANHLDDVNGAPLVVATTPPSTGGTAPYNYLPGGFFYDASVTGDKAFHNVQSPALGSLLADVDIGNTPPGWEAGEAPAGMPTGATWTTQLQCAGSSGCHGNHAQSDQNAAISGWHHGGAAGTEYRMLSGISGVESATYVVTGNRYSAVNRTNATNTISALCAQCHGAFHGENADTISSGAWVRHPTDLRLSNAVNGDNHNAFAGNAEVPVGSVGAGAPVAATNAYVICISCHVAHGGPYADLLRWDYTLISANTQGAGKGTGCFRCHTGKDGI